MRSTKPWCHVVSDTVAMATCLLDGVGSRLLVSPSLVWSAMPCHDHEGFYAVTPLSRERES